jgi:uncharacterized membrane protein YqhA
MEVTRSESRPVKGYDIKNVKLSRSATIIQFNSIHLLKCLTTAKKANNSQALTTIQIIQNKSYKSKANNNNNNNNN